MASERFKIVFTGDVAAGHDVESVKDGLAALFKTDRAKVERLFTGVPIDVRKDLDRVTAEKYKAAIEGTGASCRIEPMEPVPVEPHAAPGPTAAGASVTPAGEAAMHADHAAPEVRTRPAAAGMAWISEGFAMFKARPVPWIAVVVMWAVLTLLLGLIPLIGPIAAHVLQPVLIAGVVLGCYEAAEGGQFEPRHLFAGFSNNLGALLGIGGLYFAGTLAVGLIATLVMAVLGGGMAMVMHAVGMAEGQPGPTMMPMMGGAMMLGPLFFLALIVPVMMAFWFAPPLVVLGGLPTFEAIKQSFEGCWRNVVPFLIYGLVLLLLSIVAVIPLGLGFLVVGPIIMASVFTSYRDIYGTP